jgi:2-C-methyl-D-erythritol 2,4-cyclodiphosphate synthase
MHCLVLQTCATSVSISQIPAADYKGIDSKILLRDVMKLIRAKGYEIGNIDSTICLQRPKINPHIPEMKLVLAEVMGIDLAISALKPLQPKNLVSWEEKKAFRPIAQC